MRTIDIPRKNIFRFNFGTNEKPEYGHMRYVFDGEGNELGMFNSLTCDGKVDTSTAGRKVGQRIEIKIGIVMTDNFHRLKKLMNFSDEDKFYYLQILARSKDGNDKATKVVKNYYIKNEEYYDSHEQQIKDLCEFFNARAYLRMNRRSFKQVAFQNNKQLADVLANEQYEFVKNCYSKACGRTNVEKNKIWIVDIDDPFEGMGLGQTAGVVADYITILQQLQDKKSNYKVLDMFPTVNGFHILTNPFRVDVFLKQFETLTKDDIKHDNPTVLYAPDM